MSKGHSGVSPAPQLEGINSLALCLLSSPALTTPCDHWEDNTLDYTDLVGRIMPLLFNTLSRFAIAFLPRSDHLLISWLQSPSVVMSEPKKRKSVTIFPFSPSICHGIMGPDAMILVLFCFVLFFLIVSLSWLFHSSPSPSLRSSLVLH